MDFVLQRLLETRDCRFLLVLSNLCVCDGRPIPSTQSTWLYGLGVSVCYNIATDAVLNKLVRPHGKSVFFRLEVGGSKFCPEGEKGVVYFQRPGSSNWRPLLEIAPQVSGS